MISSRRRTTSILRKSTIFFGTEAQEIPSSTSTYPKTAFWIGFPTFCGFVMAVCSRFECLVFLVILVFCALFLFSSCVELSSRAWKLQSDVVGDRDFCWAFAPQSFFHSMSFAFFLVLGSFEQRLLFMTDGMEAESGIPCIDPGGRGTDPVHKFWAQERDRHDQPTHAGHSLFQEETVHVPTSTTCAPLLRLVSWTLWMREWLRRCSREKEKWLFFAHVVHRQAVLSGSSNQHHFVLVSLGVAGNTKSPWLLWKRSPESSSSSQKIIWGWNGEGQDDLGKVQMESRRTLEELTTKSGLHHEHHALNCMENKEITENLSWRDERVRQLRSNEP